MSACGQVCFGDGKQPIPSLSCMKIGMGQSNFLFCFLRFWIRGYVVEAKGVCNERKRNIKASICGINICRGVWAFVNIVK